MYFSSSFVSYIIFSIPLNVIPFFNAGSGKLSSFFPSSLAQLFTIVLLHRARSLTRKAKQKAQQKATNSDMVKVRSGCTNSSAHSL